MDEKFLEQFADMYCDVVPFDKIKKVRFIPISEVCKIISKNSNLSKEKIDSISKDGDVLDFTYSVSLLTNILILKMCRTYYTIVGIVIGIIISLLFMYFMG